jgi:hypothetical protein
LTIGIGLDQTDIDIGGGKVLLIADGEVAAICGGKHIAERFILLVTVASFPSLTQQAQVSQQKGQTNEKDFGTISQHGLTCFPNGFKSPQNFNLPTAKSPEN